MMKHIDGPLISEPTRHPPRLPVGAPSPLQAAIREARAASKPPPAAAPELRASIPQAQADGQTQRRHNFSPAAPEGAGWDIRMTKHAIPVRTIPAGFSFCRPSFHFFIKGSSHANRFADPFQGIHPDRAAGRDRDHRGPDRAAACRPCRPPARRPGVPNASTT